MPFLIQTGFLPENVHWVPISGLSGDNLKDRVSSEICPWYNGPSLVELLDTIPLASRNPDAPLRLPVLDKSKDQGKQYLFGKIEQGMVRQGDKCMVAPVNNPCQIAVIYNSKDKEVPYARPGEDVKLELLHIQDDTAVSKGNVLCHQDQIVPVSEVIEAELELLELVQHKPIFARGSTAMFHMHTLAEDAVIKEILEATEKDVASGELVNKVKPKYVRSYAKARVRISFKYPIAVEKYSQLSALGSFTLRDENKTIANGRVLKYKPAQTMTL